MMKNFRLMSLLCSVLCSFWCFSSLKVMCYPDDYNDSEYLPVLGNIIEIPYGKNSYLNMTLHLKGIPTNAREFKVYMYSASDPANNVSVKQDHVSEDINLKKQLSEHFNKSELFIKLFAVRKKKQLICTYKLPFEFRFKEDAWDPRGPRHSCLEHVSCKYKVKITCNNQQFAPSEETTSDMFSPYVTIKANSNLNEKHELDTSVGETVTFSCEFKGDKSGIFLKWNQTTDDGRLISELTGNVEKELKLQLTMDIFDNNTNLYCGVFVTEKYLPKHVASSNATKIILSKHNQNILLEGRHQESCYSNWYPLKCPESLYAYWWEIKRDNKTFKYYDDNIEFNMIEEHIDSRFVCLGYSNCQNNELFIRKIQSIQIYHLDKEENCKAVIPLPSTTHRNDLEPDGDNTENTLQLEKSGGSPGLLIYGLIAGAVLLIGLLAACYCFKQKRVGPQPQHIVTYSTTQVQYADLAELPSTGSRTRTVQRDDSPYAEIIGFMEPANK